jgi:hypothetical protein
MIADSILFPTLFSDIAEAEPARSLACSSAVSLLQDLTENCMLFLDTEGAIMREISDALKNWPAEHQKRISSILERAAKRGRVVRLPLTHSGGLGCCSGCKLASDLLVAARDLSPSIVSFVADSCRECAEMVGNKTTVYSLADYPLSAFFNVRRASRSITLGDGQWNLDDLAEKFMLPLVKYSSIVKIYDRLLIKSMWTEAEKRTPREHLQFAVPSNFRLTLNWLFGLLKSKGLRPRIEIYSVLQTGSMDTPTLTLAKEAIAQFEKNAKAQFDLDVKVIVKKETSIQGMPHGRYIMTSQFAFLVERGFDLLWDDDRMQAARMDPSRTVRKVRDVSISLCEDPSSVDNMTRRLRPAF